LETLDIIEKYESITAKKIEAANNKSGQLVMYKKDSTNPLTS